jgi:hypothetical protein
VDVVVRLFRSFPFEDEDDDEDEHDYYSIESRCEGKTLAHAALENDCGKGYDTQRKRRTHVGLGHTEGVAAAVVVLEGVPKAKKRMNAQRPTSNAQRPSPKATQS